MKILVTGSAGFIGFNIILKLLENKNNFIVGIDNFNNYYDVTLKKKRISFLKKKNINKNFINYKLDIANEIKLFKLFDIYKFDVVINMAAQAGVRYSVKNPKKYFSSNVQGFFNILNFCKDYKIKHLISASSSSVYGDQNVFPIKEYFNTENPLQFYAATKKSNEVFAHSFSKIYNLKITILRLFTVYGPWGRPDMALYKFVDSIFNNKNIYIYNNGKHLRDFTYIDDVVILVNKLINKKKIKKFDIFNIGYGKSEKLLEYVRIIEFCLKKKAKIVFKKKQVGDVVQTYSDSTKIQKLLNYKPKIDIKTGISKFIEWYLQYNR